MPGKRDLRSHGNREKCVSPGVVNFRVSRSDESYYIIIIGCRGETKTDGVFFPQENIIIIIFWKINHRPVVSYYYYNRARYVTRVPVAYSISTIYIILFFLLYIYTDVSKSTRDFRAGILSLTWKPRHRLVGSVTIRRRVCVYPVVAADDFHTHANIIILILRTRPEISFSHIIHTRIIVYNIITRVCV